MDVVDFRDHLIVPAALRMKWWPEVDSMWPQQQKEKEEKEDMEGELVEVLLRGKAPWGFTLRGGTEHREPLVITKKRQLLLLKKTAGSSRKHVKVEAGSVAAAVCLQPGDVMVSVNSVLLSGSRQEAICLVKSSHKTLTLGVRRAKMVDVVTPRTMPSESDVHVARNFLTKILRSSMRKNDPGLRPHSWHSSKLSEEERARREATAEPDWQPKHEDRPDESTTPGEQEPQRHLTSHISLVSSMERLERPSQHPYTPDRISPTKYINTAEPIGKKDSTGFSCFSTGSSPPVHDQSTCSRKGTSTENIFFKGLQSEVERPRYLQSMLGGGGWEEQPSSRGSVVGRPGVNPLWQVPENKKSQSPPPPPTSQLRGDSFATTKVFPYSEGQAKIHGKSAEKLAENNDRNNGLRSHQDKTTSEARRSLNPLPTKDFLHPSTAADLNHNKVHPNKLISLSSIDVRQSPQTQIPDHQRQYSDESPLYLHKKSAPPTKVQSVGSYYRSLQDLPTNAFSRKHARHSTSCAANGGHNRQYSLMGKHSVHSDPQARLGKANSNEPPGFQSSFLKAKHSLPQSQVPFSENKERNGQSHPGNPGLHYDQRTRSLENAAKRGEGHPNDVKRNFPIHQSTDHKASSIPRQKDPWLLQEDHRISPLKTPLLHSLAQESRTLAERQQQQQQQAAAMNKAAMMSTHDSAENMAALGVGVKCNRRSDRYATTLRNEIQEKRAQLQKSRSAATLTCDVEEDETEEWRSIDTSKSPGVSYSNTYKDNLKEAQARVLQATSFQRRDLGRLVPEATLVKTANGRVRGRKRLPLPKRTHSFSEPDKIDKVGVEGESQTTGSFGEQRKFFEAKPAFSRPVLKSSQGGTNVNTDPGEILVKFKEITPVVSTDPGDKQVSLEQQRLGTFAEYQATWNKQKKSSEVKAVGKYYSAENILDTEPEEKAVCIHERSRSSPSADFYAHNIPSPWRDPYSQLSTSRESTESMTLRYPADHHSPQSGLSVPKYEGLCVPGLADQTPKPDTANPSHTPTPHRLSSPNPSQLLPLTKGLLPPPPPPPKPHIGPKTTSSSQEFLSVAGADTPAFQPLSSSNTDTQNHATNAGLSTSASPGADTSSGGVEKEKEGRSALTVPADPSRSPSPQFAPQRLTDRPPAVSVQNDSLLRSDNDLNPPADMDVSSPVRKVPVKIIQSESGVEREGRAYLPQNTDTAILDLLPHIPSLSPTERPNSSLFSAFTRQASQDLVSVQESVCEEDTKREELARCIMGKDKSLADILDQSGRMTTMDLMEGLFPTEEQVLEGTQQRRRASVGSRSIDRKEEEEVSAAASLVPSSSYYNTSAPKAELLIKMKDMKQQLDDQDSEDELDIDLASKKQQLISSLARKLDVLREARFSLLDDVEDNDALGRAVEGTVARRCRPNQLDKFRMFVGDLDKVVSLLLSLSGRLARVENALNGLEEDAPPEEKRTLTEKRKLLMRQHEDAKELKENLDRRERLVSGIMASHLDPESLDDYRHFVKMKSALIIEQRKLEDKIKLGEEQLKCLVDSLPLDQRLLF